jgi:methylated-DNA-[protein]-cysteine S-methyltransferase
MTQFAVFDTAVGPCGVAWRAAGLAGLLLPDRSADATAARLRTRSPDARPGTPPPAVEQAIAAIVSLLRGARTDLSFITLDMTGVPPFHRRVYEAARAIPAGETWAYGDLARRVGAPGAARAVGQALGRNPFALIVPCHRVVAASGAMHGFTAPGGVTTKQRLLEIEGALAPSSPALF